MVDSVYRASLPPPSLLPHHYGDSLALSACPVLQQALAQLCQPSCQGLPFFQLLRLLYQGLLHLALACKWPLSPAQVQTRMAKQHGATATVDYQSLRQDIPIVVVDMLRAGLIPSQTIYEQLMLLMPTAAIRQDHLVVARQSNATGKITGANLEGRKIGGPLSNQHLILPDPMGATGTSMVQCVQWYKQASTAQYTAIWALHLIVTPEYLREMKAQCPEVTIFAVRVDRGLSPPAILQQPLGAAWQQEQGLDSTGYIVPGAGGLGELCNNAVE